MTSSDPLLAQSEPKSFVGTWRRFGLGGPVYEITGADHQLADGDWMMRVHVLESGEEVDYRLKDLMEDPAAA